MGRTISMTPVSYDRVLRRRTSDWPLSRRAAPRADLTGCPWHDVKAMLRQVGLRPTRQRMALGWILFAKGDRHLTAEMLYEEATKAKVPVSLATVYNTLHQFTEVGPAAPGRGRRLEDLFRHQRLRPSPLLRRRRERAARHSGRRRDASARCRTRRKATRSRASTSWCGCARQADIESAACGDRG